MADQPTETPETEIKVTPNEFVDALTFFAALKSYQEVIATDVTTDDEAEAIYKKGAILMKTRVAWLEEGLRTFGLTMADKARVKTRFQSALAGRLVMNLDYKQVSPTAVKRFNALTALLPILLRKGSLLTDTFPEARVASALKRLCKAVQSDNPLARLSGIAAIPATSPTGVAMIRWIDVASAKAGVVLSSVDATAKETETAQALGSAISVVDAKLTMVDPGAPEAEDLANQRANLTREVDRIAENSKTPEAVKTTVAQKMVEHSPQQTATGNIAKLNPQQEDAMLSEGKTIIAAGAGSGKTRVLAAKVVYSIKELGAKPEQVLATSFSNKSAQELQDRIRKFGGSDIMGGLEMTQFHTTHKAAGDIVNKYGGAIGLGRGKETRLDPDKGDPNKLIWMAIAQVEMRGGYNPRPHDPNEVLIKPFDPATAPPPALKPQDSENPAAPQPPAGTVKLDASVFTATQDADMVSAYQDALQKTIDKLRTSGPRSGYVQDFGVREFLPSLISTSRKYKSIPNLTDKMKVNLNRFFGMANLNYKVASMEVLAAMDDEGETESLYGDETKDPDTVKPDPEQQQKDRVFGELKNRYKNTPANRWFNLGIGKKAFKDAKGNPIGPRRVSTFISKNKGGLSAPGALWERNKGALKDEEGNYTEQALLIACYGAYEFLKNEGLIPPGSDADDVIINAAKVLVQNPQARKDIQDKFKYVFVDEAQDLNPAQHLMFGMITGHYDAATLKPKTDGTMTAKTYCLIGDDKQAIYEFRGAEPEIFVNMSDLTPDAGGGFKTKLLDVNYRSGSLIVDAANRLIAHNEKQIPMVCQADPRNGQGNISAVLTEDNNSAAALFADECEKATKGDDATAKYGDFGVAVRTNAEGIAYSLECLKRGIPFKSKLDFFNNFTTASILNWMKLATLPLSAKAEMNTVFFLCTRNPNFGLDKIFKDRVEQVCRGKNYYECLVGGAYRDVYTFDQTSYKNEKHVKPYLDTIKEIRDFAEKTGKSMDLIEKILHLRGASFYKGMEPRSFEEDLIEQIKGSPEMIDLLVEENEGQPVTEQQIKQLALAPVQPLMELAGQKSDVNSLLAYLEVLRKANKDKHKPEKDQSEEAKNSVTIDTAHGWKGLETAHVYIPMPKGTFPHKRSESDPKALASERRLAYVAITRGKQSSTILCPMLDSAGRPVGPSQFVSEACIHITGGEKAPTEAGGAAKTAQKKDEGPEGLSADLDKIENMILEQEQKEQAEKEQAEEKQPEEESKKEARELLAAWGME